MDIERLKELKTNLMFEKDVSDEATRFDRDSETNRTVHHNCNDLIALIDAEIARQSVKSEEVQEAIAKIEKIVAFDSENGYRVNNHHSLHISDIKTALVAMQEYQLKGE